LLDEGVDCGLDMRLPRHERDMRRDCEATNRHTSA
jgi:hypothetical protein